MLRDMNALHVGGPIDRSDKTLHYHIHWSGKEELDWENFGARAEAEGCAKRLVHPGEAYTIEEFKDACPRCRDAFKLKTEHETQPAGFKYQWQQSVSDASTETRPEFVSWKVNAAQRAIVARLLDKPPTGLDEQIAIREALQSLCALFPEPKKENRGQRDEPGEKKKATA